MSKSKITQTRINPEVRKFPFEQTFLCPKCSEILLINIYYIGKTIIPQVNYTCPKRHSGNVDLPLFFNLFHSANKDIEEELSKFDDTLEKDIEAFKDKKMKEGKILDPINFSQMINKKQREKENEKNKEENNKDEIPIKEEIKHSLEDSGNPQLFKEIKKCSEIEFSLLNGKKKIVIEKEKNHPKSETKTNEKPEKKESNEKKPKKVNKSNKSSFSPKGKTNNINTIKSEEEKEEPKEEEKNKKEEDPKKEEKKETKEQKEIKESKEDKYMCSSHGNRYTGYCFSCKKNMCKKCFKRGHKKRKIYSNILLSEKNLNDLNKHLNQCQESLNKFENKVHLLIEELNNKERNEKIILNIMSKAFIDMNKENLKEIKDTIKTYVNCVKKSMLNYETIMNVKNLEFKNVITIPKDIFELIKIFKNYKNHIVYKNMNKKSTSENDDKDKENKYIQLFEAFFNVLKKYENKEINFKEIVENEDFRKIINSNDYGNIEIKKEIKNLSEDEKEVNDIEKMEEFDMNYLDDGYDNYEDYLEEEEEENELEYEDDLDDYNAENIEDEYNYVISENMRIEQNEKKESKE